MPADLLTASLAVVLTAACTGPQVIRATRATEGISPAAWLQAFVLGSVWAAYGLATRAWILLLSEGLFAAGSLCVLLRVMPWVQVAMWASVCLALLAVAFLTLGPGWCLSAAAVASLSMRVAQAHALVLTESASGVSLWTWCLLAASNFAWASTGVLRMDVLFALSAALGGAGSLGVIVTCMVVRRRTREPVAHSGTSCREVQASPDCSCP